MPTVHMPDGRVIHFPYDMPPEAIQAEVEKMIAPEGSMASPAPAGTPDQEPEGSGGASAFLGALRAAPAVGRGLAGFAARHPAGTQKAIGAGISTVAGGIGAGIGGVPGAVVGASIRGVTPAQSVIRETAGRLAGEAPAVAKNAGRAVAVANYATEAGLPLKPTQLVSTGNAARALDNYAESMGQRVPRILDQYGKVVVGPEAPPTPRTPSRIGGAASKAASSIGRLLAPLQVMTGATDFAQTVEPNRRDIGVMGIGRSQPTPQGDELAQINQRNIAAAQQRAAQQDQYWADVRSAVLSRLGLR